MSESIAALTPRDSTPGAPGSLTGLLIAVSCGAILAPLNSTMLAVALPEIRAQFDVSHAALGWLISSYLIAMAVGQPIGGRLGDSFGRARVFSVALWAFVAMSIAAALAPSFGLLVLCRTAQAAAGALVMPNAMAMLRQGTPPDRMGRVFGLNGAAVSCAAAFGPFLGAALLATGSWRAIFVLNVPVIAVALALRGQLPWVQPQTARRAVDWLGAILFVLTLAALTQFLTTLRDGFSLPFLTAAAATVGLGVLFAWRLATAEAPTIEWRLFRQRSFAAGTLHVLLTNLVMYTTLLTVPFFVEEVQHRGSSVTGILLGVMSVLMTVTAPCSGWLSDRYGRRLPTLVGSAVLVAGAIALAALLSPSVSVVTLAAVLAVIGTGVGISVSSASTAAIEAAPLALAGAASGANSMMRYLGSIVGAGVLAAVLTTDGGTSPSLGAFRVIASVLVVGAIACVPVASMLHRFVLVAEVN